MTGERRCPRDGSMPEGVPRRSALTIRNRPPAQGSMPSLPVLAELGHSPMGTAANENPPDGIIDHRAGSLEANHRAVRKTPRPDVTTGLVGWKYAGKTD
jgi:hypothetical protein